MAYWTTSLDLLEMSDTLKNRLDHPGIGSKPGLQRTGQRVPEPLCLRSTCCVVTLGALGVTEPPGATASFEPASASPVSPCELGHSNKLHSSNISQ
jgi:hypothetical protein